jgi:steroid delta-isomerase-like uncharacterized protein
MSIKNKALVRKLNDEMNTLSGNLDKINAMMGDFCAPEFVNHRTTGDLNLEQFIQYMRVMFSAFPNATFTIDDMIAEGDKVVYRSRWSGTHKGEFQGIPPTGKTVTVTGANIARIAEGKLIEMWAFQDAMGMMQQLGAIPSQ